MTRRASFIAILVCLSLSGLSWSVLREQHHRRTRENLESQLEALRNVIGRAQRSLLQRLNDAESIGMNIRDIPDAEILADEIFTPESDGWEYVTRSYKGPRNGDFRVLYYGLDDRPPKEYVADFFMVYLLNGEITDVREVSPLY